MQISHIFRDLHDAYSTMVTMTNFYFIMVKFCLGQQKCHFLAIHPYRFYTGNKAAYFRDELKVIKLMTQV